MRSDAVKTGTQQAPHRSLFNALGMTKEEMDRPLVGIVSLTLKRYIRMFIQLGIIMLPFFFFTPSASNFFVWALWALIVFVYACLVVAITGFIFERKVFMAVIKRIKGMVKRKV